jgi:hypothetical protein
MLLMLMKLNNVTLNKNTYKQFAVESTVMCLLRAEL